MMLLVILNFTGRNFSIFEMFVFVCAEIWVVEIFPFASARYGRIWSVAWLSTAPLHSSLFFGLFSGLLSGLISLRSWFTACFATFSAGFPFSPTVLYASFVFLYIASK